MVKASDSKSDGVSPRRFESCPLRIVLFIVVAFSFFSFVVLDFFVLFMSAS